MGKIGNLSSNAVRSAFINFFKDKKNHIFVPSASVIPYNDPTLLFTNAGMNQFKPIFQGDVDPNSDMAKLKRVVNSQKCIRAGGKHNDLGDVGKDVYHHTFFEMLGNWSFGDYFKKEICEWAWEFLTTELRIDEDRLYVSYFGGDKDVGLEPDLECKQIWLNLGLPESRILPFNMKDNFWEMGDVGPCGPCSEIFYDRIGNRDASHLVNADDPMVVEIWNLVFMQYNREENRALKHLPRKHIDCGMGFERLVSVLQDVHSNYDTDVFQPIISRIGDFSRVGRYSGKIGKADSNEKDTAYRIIADHMRTVSVALGDGVQPAGTNRGFVIRKMLRRAAFATTEILQMDRNALADIATTVIDNLRSAYPELHQNETNILNIIKKEEDNLYRIVDKGKELFESLVRELPPTSKIFPGDLAFQLHDTHGFTIDLTQKFALTHGLTVDFASFQHHVALAREISQKQSKMSSKLRST